MNIKDVISSRLSRRQVLVTSLGALGLALLSPLRSLFAQNDHGQKGKKSLFVFNAGKPESFTLQRVDSRFRDSHGVWIIRHLDSLYGLSVKTPEGQLTEWNETGQYFSTSSGAQYYKSGIFYQGLKRKSLERVAVSLTRQGNLEIDPVKTFRQARGEWAHPQSFLRIPVSL